MTQHTRWHACCGHRGMLFKTTLTIASALLLTACTMFEATSPDASAPASPAESDTASAIASPASEAASPTPTTSPAASASQVAMATCESTELGYTVSYPEGWWANDAIDAEEPVQDIGACQYFAPSPVELEPGTDDLSGIAIRFEIREGDTGTTGQILSSDETTVDGRTAVVREVEVPPQAGFIPEGSVAYEYAVELQDGSTLVALADNIGVDEATYEDAKPVVDQMLDTIEIEERSGD